MRLYHDQDADLSLLADQPIAVIGYGNQGRAQALNLRDSALNVTVVNLEDEFAAQARADGFSVLPVAQERSGRTEELALALARGIGSTTAGVAEVTIAQEAALDLFAEQCWNVRGWL